MEATDTVVRATNCQSLSSGFNYRSDI